MLARAEYDVALNLGVCGSFDRALAPGSVVHVVTDRLPNWAPRTAGRLPIQELESARRRRVSVRRRLVNAKPPSNMA